MLFSLNKAASVMSTSFVFSGQKSAKLQSRVMSHHTAEELSENKKSKSQHLERKLKLLLYGMCGLKLFLRCLRHILHSAAQHCLAGGRLYSRRIQTHSKLATIPQLFLDLF